jgi:quercetin dioxygenase-like cupin family protein
MSAPGSETWIMAPYVLRPDEGDPRLVIDEIDVVKASPGQTGGLFGLKISHMHRGSAPPLHVHTREDEGCYVLEGDATFYVGDDVIPASAGTWVYLPRDVPHSMRAESDARSLWVVVPGDFMSFFVETFPSLDEANVQPDFDKIAEAASRYGVTVIGPAPQEGER